MRLALGDGRDLSLAGLAARRARGRGADVVLGAGELHHVADLDAGGDAGGSTGGGCAAAGADPAVDLGRDLSVAIVEPVARAGFRSVVPVHGHVTSRSGGSCGRRFRTYRRCKPHKILSIPALCKPWAKAVSQKSKRRNLTIYLLIVPLAVNNLAFLPMYFQPTHLHSFLSIASTYSACFWTHSVLPHHLRIFPTCTSETLGSSTGQKRNACTVR